MACIAWNVWRKTESTETIYLYSVYYDYHNRSEDEVRKELIEDRNYPEDIELECDGNVEDDYDPEQDHE